MYGKSVAGLILERIIEKENLPKNKKALIGSIVENLHHGLIFIERGNDSGLYERFYDLWVKHIVATVKSASFSREIETHLLSTIKGLAKQRRREFHILHNKDKMGKRRIEKLKKEFCKYDKHFNTMRKKLDRDKTNDLET